MLVPREADFCFCAETPYTNFLYSSTANFLLSSTEVDMILLQTVSYYCLWKALTTSWLSISSIFSRLLGLKTITFSSKSIKGGEKSFKKFNGFEFVEILIYFIIDFDTYDSREMMSYSLG